MLPAFNSVILSAFEKLESQQPSIDYAFEFMQTYLKRHVSINYESFMISNTLN